MRTRQNNGTLDNIIQFIGDLTQSRAVCKNFVRKCDIGYVKFLTNSPWSALRLALERPCLKTVVFDRCDFMWFAYLFSLLQKHLNITGLILNNCEGLYKDNCAARILDQNNTRCMLAVEDRLVSFRFKGCWTVFDCPATYLGPKEVVRTVMGALNSRSLLSTYGRNIAKRFLSNGRLLSLRLNMCDIDDIFRRDTTWKISSPLFVGTYSVITMTNSSTRPFVWILVEQEDSWKMKRGGFMTLSTAWELMSHEYYNYYNPIDTCNTEIVF